MSTAQERKSDAGAGSVELSELDFSENEIVPIAIIPEQEFPVVNSKATDKLFRVYTGFKPEPGNKKTILVASKWFEYDVAPVGSIVQFSYVTGTWRNTYHKYRQWFVVDKGDYEIELQDEIGSKNIKVKLKNLRPLPHLDDFTVSKAKAEIYNANMVPSERDPVEKLYAYWVIHGVHKKQEEKEEQTVEEIVEEEVQEDEEKEVPLPPVPEPARKELEVELEPTAVKTEAKMERKAETSGKQELVKIYLLSMKLPSRYLVQQIKYDKGSEIRSWSGVNAELASKLEGIRREAYDKISRIFAHVEDYGTWIAVSDEAVNEAEGVSNWVRQKLKELPLSNVKNIDVDKLYTVKAVPIYLEPEHAKELLKSAIRKMSQDVAELESRIEQAQKEGRKKALYTLEKDHNYRKALLEVLRKQLEKLEA